MAEISLRKSLDFFIKLESDLLKACKGKNLKCGKFKLEDQIKQYFTLDFESKASIKGASLKDLKIKYDEYIGTGKSKNGGARAACIFALVSQMANLKVNMMGPMKVLADKRKVQYGNKDNILAEKAMESAEAKISGYLGIGADVSNMKDVNDELKKCTKVMGKIYDVWEKKYEKKLKNILEKLGNIDKDKKLINDYINSNKKPEIVDGENTGNVLGSNACIGNLSDLSSDSVDVNLKYIQEIISKCTSFSNPLVNGIKETIANFKKDNNEQGVTFVENVKQAVKIYDKIEKELDSWNENRTTYGRYLAELKKIEDGIRKEVSDENAVNAPKRPLKGKILRTLVGYNIKPNGYKYKATFGNDGMSMYSNIKAEDKEVIDVNFFLKMLKSFTKSKDWKEIKKNAKNAAKDASGEEAAKKAAKEADLADAASLAGKVYQLFDGEIKYLLNEIKKLYVIKISDTEFRCIDDSDIIGKSVYASNFKKIYDAFEIVEKQWTNFSDNKTNWSNGDKKHIREYSVAFQKIKSTVERFRDKIMKDFKKYYPQDNNVSNWDNIMLYCVKNSYVKKEKKYILEDISNTVANSYKKRRMLPPQRDFQKDKGEIIAYFESLKKSLERDKDVPEASAPNKAWFDAMISDTNTIRRGMENHKESDYWGDEWEKLRKIKDCKADGSWKKWYDNYLSVLGDSKKIWNEDLPSFNKTDINPPKDEAPRPAATLPGNNETS